MVIDTSAVLAWLKHEPARERIVATLEAHPICRISAVSVLEAQIVVRAREHPAMLGPTLRNVEFAFICRPTGRTGHAPRPERFPRIRRG